LVGVDVFVDDIDKNPDEVAKRLKQTT